MAKRKLSTFERLQRGRKLSRRERKEMERRFQREDPGWASDLKAELNRALGVDLTRIDGIHVMTGQTLYAELGPALGAAFPSEDHFASWLMPAPKKRCERGQSDPALLDAFPQPGGAGIAYDGGVAP